METEEREGPGFRVMWPFGQQENNDPKTANGAS